MQKAKSGKLKIRKGDKVRVISGKDKGREGEVVRAIPEEGKVVVAGINIVKHFTKKTQKEPGGIIEAEAPLWASKVVLICPKCKKPSRLRKGRVCKNCKAEI